MRFGLFLAFIFIAHSAGAAQNSVVLPLPWRGPIHLDQTRNIPLPPGLQAISGQIVPIYHIDVPVDEARLYQSQFLDDGTKSTVFVRVRGKNYVRIFFLRRNQFPQAQQTHWGTKVLSHNTYFVFDPTNTRQEELYIKFQDADGANSETQVWQAIQNNDTVETILKENKDSSLLFLPERFGVGYKNHAYSVRKVRPNIKLSANKDLLSLHSIFTTDKSEENPEAARAVADVAAEMMGMSKNEWILSEYLPKLTKFILKLAIVHGIVPAAHTQNLQIVLNSKTGVIEGFAFRDMNDVLIDPTLRVLRSNGAHIRLPVSSVNISFIDPDNLEARGLGRNLATYFLQSVFGISRDPQFRQELASQFIRLFKQQFEEISGLRLRGVTPHLDQAQILAGGLYDWRLFHSSLQLGLQESFDSLMASRTSRLKDKSSGKDQEGLRRLFLEKLETFEVIPVKPHFIEKIQADSIPLLFELRGNMIIGRSGYSGQLVAIAYNIEVRPKVSVTSCKGLFK